MRTKIYTKTGDRGETSLIGGQRVSKSDPRLDSYGTLDELNTVIGLSVSQWSLNRPTLGRLKNTLIRIQNDLFIMGSHLACESAESRKMLPHLQKDFCTLLEDEMDFMDGALPELKEFILPGGHPIAALLHVARAICRRAERAACTLEKSEITSEIVRQLNRLSDYLFVASRYVNHEAGKPETTWQKPADEAGG